MSRRAYITSASLAASGMLAGCSGSGGNEEGSDSSGGQSGGDTSSKSKPGERIPTLQFSYWTDMGFQVPIQEAYVPILKENWKEIGVNMEINPRAVIKAISPFFNDERTFHIGAWGARQSPDRLDADPQLWRWNIMWAGANGRANASNYASCDYSMAALNQRRATSKEKRQEYVTKALKQIGEDIGVIDLYKGAVYGGYWSDKVNIRGMGKQKLVDVNANVLIESTSKNDSPVVANNPPTLVNKLNQLDQVVFATLTVWTKLLHANLVDYDENYQLFNSLAKSREVENDATKFTFELRDATFHDGTPIRAEDVKWTYTFLKENADVLPKVSSPPYDSIDVIDEKTVQFNTKEPFLPLITKVLPRWGVLSKKAWMEHGADSKSANKVSFGNNIVGSGPYKIKVFNRGESIHLTPHEGFPETPRRKPESDIVFVGFDGLQEAFTAFRNEEINIIRGISPNIGRRIERELPDAAKSAVTKSFISPALVPQMSFPPFQFREFREAISQSIDRNKIIDTAFFGETEPAMDGNIWSDLHPWHPGSDELPSIADSADANVDKAKQLLKDEGWTWDDKGRLRYPEEKDLTPVWPKGSSPAEHPDEFPCVEELKKTLG